MRRLTATLISLALAASMTFAQGFLAPPCTPQGTSFTESFGDAGAPCGFGSSTGCNQTWSVGAGSPVIIASSVGAPPQCGHSLQINPSAAAEYIFTEPTQAFAAGATVDVYAQIEFTTAPSSNFDNILTLGAQSNGSGSYTAQIYAVNGSPFALAANGSSQSTGINVSTGVSHLLHLHLAAGTNASYLQIDASAEEAFTEGANPSNYIIIGTPSAMTTNYTIGAVWANASSAPNCATNTYPQMMINFEGGSSGASPSAANLEASTLGGNGVWSISSSPQLTFQTAAQLGNFVTPPDICGTYESGTGSLGLQWATEASGSGYISFAPTVITSPTVSESFLWETNYPATNTDVEDLAEIAGVSAADFVTASEHGTGTSLEITIENHTGTPINVTPVSPNHLYQIVIQYNETGSHEVCVYDGVTASLLACNTMAAVGGIAPSLFRIGKVGSEAGTSGYDSFYDNVLIDYMTGAMTPF